MRHVTVSAARERERATMKNNRPPRKNLGSKNQVKPVPRIRRTRKSCENLNHQETGVRKWNSSTFLTILA